MNISWRGSHNGALLSSFGAQLSVSPELDTAKVGVTIPTLFSLCSSEFSGFGDILLSAGPR